MSVELLLSSFIATAARSPQVLEGISAVIGEIVRKEIRSALSDRDADVLQELIKMFPDKSREATRAMIRRDPELAALGVRVGQKRLFRKSEVVALFKRRAEERAPRLRAVGDEGAR